jgi:hypothetical protein
MLKRLSICATLIAFGTGSVGAQREETITQKEKQNVTMSKIEVPGADFDIIFITAEFRAGMTDDLQSDPLAYAGLQTRVYLVPKGK